MRSIFNDEDIYEFFNVDVEFTERVYGGIPKSPELIKNWIEAKGEMPRESMEEKLEAMASQDLIEEEERAWTGFRSDETGLYLRDFQIEAMIKQAGTVLGIFVKSRGSKTIAQEGLHVQSPRIYLCDQDSRPIQEPHGSEDVPGHVMTMQGKRSILRRMDYCDPGTIVHFSLKMVKGQNKLKVDDLKKMVHIGQDLGLGSKRSLSGGKFAVTAFEKVIKQSQP